MRVNVDERSRSRSRCRASSGDEPRPGDRRAAQRRLQRQPDGYVRTATRRRTRSSHQNPAAGHAGAAGVDGQRQRLERAAAGDASPTSSADTSQQAVQALEAAGFKVSQQHARRSSDPSQNNIVQSQSPAGNSQAPKDSTVTITSGSTRTAAATTTTTDDDHHPLSSARRLRVAVLAGGRSSEHEISLASARSVVGGARPRAVRGRRDRDRPRRPLGARGGPGPSSHVLVPGTADGVRRRRCRFRPSAGRSRRSAPSTSSCRSCTARSARTGRCRDCSSSRTSPTSARASRPPRSRWTRTCSRR